ncbi:uncharacterized protein LOC121382208 [Gigantopelta aegis]|uniref:uncharacterized protein LOC121382208 n=1 Tax=Gigantopelta aegis TaxID=1735272 RepID=UPI001B88E13D|nr:uncharacterized protein LOC121382208 [Gigantopelta aegis]
MHNKSGMDAIPFKFLNHSTQYQLANKLDPKAPLTGNDWRMLAEKLGYKTEQIYVLDEQKTSDGRNTIKLFADYAKRQESTVNKVIKALKDMDRSDALQVLLDAMPAIEQSYRDELEMQHQRSQPMEHEMSHWSQANSTHHPPSPSCYNANISCHCIHQSQPPHREQPCLSCTSSAAAAAAAAVAYNGYHHCFTTSVNHSPYRSHGCEMNGLLKRPHDPEMHHPPFNCHSNSLHNSHVGGMAAAYSVCQTKQKLVVHDMRSRTAEEENSSMLAQADLNRSDEFSLVENDVEMIEDHVPLPNAIFRAQNQVMNIPSLLSPDIDIAREEEVSTSASEDFSSGDSDLGPLSEGLNYYRQMSEECNANQPMKNRGLRKDYAFKNIPKSASDYDVPSGPLPLENLKRLANLPKQYMPEQAYKTFVAEQKVDDSQQKMKVGRDERNSFSTCVPSRGASKCQAEGSDPKRVSPKLKNGLINTPKTFPMRVKPQSTGVTISELREQHEKTTTITKSVSLPNDMKPEVFRRAFRHIKVFVTYSQDNKKHVQRVLSLCNCLLKNGFSCSVDVQGRKMENCVQSIADVDWYRQKFVEADFVLVCVSKKYRADLENNDGDSFSDNKLHTKYIYKLMVGEHDTNQHRSLRYVPVLMEGVTHDLIPGWLQQTTVYRWPVQYKDLLWMLSKPEERINPRTKSYSQYNNMGVSPEIRR